MQSANQNDWNFYVQIIFKSYEIFEKIEWNFDQKISKILKRYFSDSRFVKIITKKHQSCNRHLDPYQKYTFSYRLEFHIFQIMTRFQKIKPDHADVGATLPFPPCLAYFYWGWLFPGLYAVLMMMMMMKIILWNVV